MKLVRAYYSLEIEGLAEMLDPPAGSKLHGVLKHGLLHHKMKSDRAGPRAQEDSSMPI